MSPPKRKDNFKATRTGASVAEDSWKSDIENLSLNEERWTCLIAMIVETNLEHAEYLDLFNEAAEEETREAIFSLSYKRLIRETKLMGKSDQHRGICHFASKQIEDQGKAAMRPWLLCRLIKFFINRIKTRHLEILESRVRIEKGITKENETSEVARPIAAATSKGGYVDAKSFDKMNTKLRKRGEEWKDRTHIDDAPIDGPNLYVVLSGFHDPKLPDELLNAGLPLTAIFKILRPGEKLDVNHPQLRTFWSSFETTLADPKTISRYSQIVCQTFCPPEIMETGLEALKTDAYRRISFLMYDLWDIKRQHDAYIRRMKLQSGLEEKRPEIQVTETYDSIMKNIPEECASVSMVLDALLSQIDGLTTRKETFYHEVQSAEALKNRFRSRIDYLNDQFDVFDVSRVDISTKNSDPRLILHGDELGCKNHHCSSVIPADLGLPVFRDFGKAILWSKVPALTSDQVEMYKYHMDQLSNCFDEHTDNLTSSHYLHLFLLDKVINGESPGKSFHGRQDLEKKASFPGLEKSNSKGTKSQIITSDKSLAESLRSSSQSDSAIEYRREITETFECHELFSLIDIRDLLGSSYSSSPESFCNQNSGNLNLGEFDSVQLLSCDVFSQVFFTCLQEFHAFETRYFAPTDSTLIFFHNNQASDRLLEQEYSANIRTPVCLRDFSEYIIDEEKEWIEREGEIHSRRLAKEAALCETQTLKTPKDLPLASFYTDADFILRNSIKAAEVRKQKSRQSLMDGTETAGFSRDEPPAKAKNQGAKETKETNRGKVKIQKRKGTMINPSHKREEGLEADPTLKKTTSVHSPEDEGPPTFLGYDIANHRVEISGSTSDFLSDDGTIVKVNREKWSYGEFKLSIIIELLGNSLVVHIVDECLMFHLTTASGIFMGFSLPSHSAEKGTEVFLGSGHSVTERNYHGGKIGRESETSKGRWMPEMAVDPGFRASWPSGLVVETLPGDGPSEPFYIKQSYLSKGPECSGISRETQRVFLRDGTIVVFLDDDSVRLMRANGCIVTCDGFAKDDKEQEKYNGGDSYPDLLTEASKSKNRRTMEVTRKRESTNSFAEGDAVLGPKSSVHNPQNLRILHTIILEPDGRLYEIYNDEITRELGQELVRTASDYEVGEKFTRRSDGTNILMNSEGSLAVSFPDDSRITTAYVIEEDPVFCEWTEEEFQRFFSTANEESEARATMVQQDGFVSIFLTSCAEHKNYATVTYDQSKNDCTLTMPGDVRAHISFDGLLSVTIVSATSLEVKRDEIVFTGRMGTPCGGSSSSVFNLEHLPTNSFLRTEDSFGNVFRVDSDGKTSYTKFGTRSDTAEEDEENYSSHSRLFTSKNNNSPPNFRGYRLFVVKRDLSAYEHLHRSVRQTQEDDSTASIFFHQLNEQPNQKLCTTLTALNPITASQACLQPYKSENILVLDHQVKNIRPTDRTDLFRSTYSDPWNYLIPYGKNGQGMHDRTWNLPLNSTPNFAAPEVLLVRTTQTIKNQGDDVFEKLKAALCCYWKKAISNFHRHRGSVSRAFTSPKKREIENWLKDFALGRRKTFDKKLYFDGLSKSRVTERQESTISKRKFSGSEDKIDKEEIEWYKSCLRDHMVPPYFADVPGACFLWVLECVNKIEEKTKEGKEQTN